MNDIFTLKRNEQNLNVVYSAVWIYFRQWGYIFGSGDIYSAVGIYIRQWGYIFGSGDIYKLTLLKAKRCDMQII